MKKCLECGNLYDPDRPACPKCGARDSITSISAEGALEFLDSLKSKAEARDSIDEGARLFQLGDLQGARDAFEEAIKINPNNPVAYSNLGHLLCKMGRPAEGIPHLEKALDLDPRIEGTAEFLESARRDFLSTESKPHHDEAYYMRRLTYVEKEVCDRAIQEFSQAI
jgi:tetratricopeptide (TPR) repeat protein